MATIVITEQITILRELQTLDAQLYALRRQLNAKPEQINQIKAVQQQLVQQSQAVEARYKAAELKKSQKEMELGQKEEQIKKLQNQLALLKTNKEYSAMQHEIEGFKADKSVLEEEILKLMDEVDQVKASMSVERQNLKVKETETNGQIAVVEAEIQKLKESADQLTAQRGEIRVKVDSSILAKYEQILERKEGVALVPVRAGSCGGCNMLLPPQLINEVHMAKRLVLCEACARILYVVDAAS